jgi:hypothetical protein
MGWKDNVGGRVVPPSEAGTMAAKERDRNYASGSTGGGWSGGSGWNSAGGSSGRSNSGCFPAGALIGAPGGAVDIATVRRGDRVLGVHPVSGATTARRVLKVVRHAERSIWSLVFADGKRVRTTARHSVRTRSGWRTAGSIRRGDQVTMCDRHGDLQTGVVALSGPEGEVEDVYSLIVEGEFTFIADGVVVHSFTYLRTLRVWGWTVVAACTPVAVPEVAPTAP